MFLPALIFRTRPCSFYAFHHFIAFRIIVSGAHIVFGPNIIQIVKTKHTHKLVFNVFLAIKSVAKNPNIPLISAVPVKLLCTCATNNIVDFQKVSIKHK